MKGGIGNLMKHAQAIAQQVIAEGQSNLAAVPAA